MNRIPPTLLLCGTLALAGAPFPGTAPTLAQATSAAPSVNADLEGRVLNAVTGAYLGGARVKVVGSGLEAITERDGSFVFTGLGNRELSLEVS